MIRLSTIDPAALAEEVHETLAARVRRLAFALGYDLHEGGAGVSEARHAVRLLAHYARTGEPPEGRPELVPEYLQTMVDLDAVPPAAELAGERDPEDPLHVVVLAALARDALTRGRGTVPDGWLAALAGLSSAQVRRLAATGELRRGADGISIADARRWLRARGVAGV